MGLTTTGMGSASPIHLSGILVIFILAYRLIDAAPAASGINFDNLSEKSKAAVISLLNEAADKTHTDPLNLIRLGLEKANENKERLARQDSPNIADFFPQEEEPAPIAQESFSQPRKLSFDDLEGDIDEAPDQQGQSSGPRLFGQASASASVSSGSGGASSASASSGGGGEASAAAAANSSSSAAHVGDVDGDGDVDRDDVAAAAASASSDGGGGAASAAAANSSSSAAHVGDVDGDGDVDRDDVAAASTAIANQPIPQPEYVEQEPEPEQEPKPYHNPYVRMAQHNFAAMPEPHAPSYTHKPTKRKKNKRHHYDVYKNSYIDHTYPNNPQLVRIKSKKRIGPDGVVEEHVETRTSVSGDPNSYGQSSTSYTSSSSSSSSSSPYKRTHHHHHGDWNGGARAFTSTMPAMAPMPPMPAMAPMPPVPPMLAMPQMPPIPQMPQMPPIAPMTPFGFGMNPMGNYWMQQPGTTTAFSSSMGGVPKTYTSGDGYASSFASAGDNLSFDMGWSDSNDYGHARGRKRSRSRY